MDNLSTLTALLDITKEAEALASEIEKPNRLRELVVELRSKAKEERSLLKRDGRRDTRYDLCLVGILEELDFGRLSWQNVTGMHSRLGRIREEIERTIIEIRAKRKLM